MTISSVSLKIETQSKQNQFPGVKTENAVACSVFLWQKNVAKQLGINLTLDNSLILSSLGFVVQKLKSTKSNLSLNREIIYLKKEIKDIGK